MEETYFVISNSDGDTTIEEYTKENLLKELGEDDWDRDGIIIKEELKMESDTNEWDGKILIIKGIVCVPKPKKIIETYEIE